MFENKQDAEQAVLALKAAGFTSDDINFMTSQDFIQAAEHGEHQNKGLAKSLAHFVSSMDYSVTDAYLNEARRGFSANFQDRSISAGTRYPRSSSCASRTIYRYMDES